MTPAVLDRPTLFDAAPPTPATRRALTTQPLGRSAPAPATRTAPSAPAPARDERFDTSTAATPAMRARLGDGGPTLEGVIAGAWEGLAAHHEVGCPLCGGHMAPRYGAAGLEPVGGRCRDCGTTLG
jgi:hypothetical protein